MNTVVLLPLQESMAQCSAGKDDHWRGYMTVLIVNQGIIISPSILSAVICTMIKFDEDKPLDCFRQEVKWTLAMR
jgi:hypothetical protein